jgi:uncharacterized membrane-anchored protein YhcB (DUF1043 family)
MAIEFVVVIAVVAALLGAGVVYFGPNKGLQRQRLRVLEKDLAQAIANAADAQAEMLSAQQQLADYRQEVLGQFSDTAAKFKVMDDSYQALYRQLASSSLALCGDAGAPLLDPPRAELAVSDNSFIDDTQTPSAITAGQEITSDDEISVAEPSSVGESESALEPDLEEVPVLTRLEPNLSVTAEGKTDGTNT